MENGFDLQKRLRLPIQPQMSWIASVRNLGIADATAAINAAEAALPTWRNKLGKDRAQIMRKWFDLIIQNTQDLASKANPFLRLQERWFMALLL